MSLRQNFDEAVRLYESGLSTGEVAARYSMTRQAMWKILKRRGVQLRTNLRFGKDNHFYRDGYEPLRRRVQNKVSDAIRKGKLTPQPCEVCGIEPRIVNGANCIQAHHDDYGKPLEVRWLCKKHHYEFHCEP